jgi:hypothetical protein
MYLEVQKFAKAIYMNCLQFREMAEAPMYSIDDLKRLYEKAEVFNAAYEWPEFRQCKWLYKNKPHWWWSNDVIRDNGGVIPLKVKGAGGDPRCPLNGRLEGIFFSVAVTSNYSLPQESPFGNTRWKLPIATAYRELCVPSEAELIPEERHCPDATHVILVEPYPDSIPSEDVATLSVSEDQVASSFIMAPANEKELDIIVSLQPQIGQNPSLISTVPPSKADRPSQITNKLLIENQEEPQIEQKLTLISTVPPSKADQPKIVNANFNKLSIDNEQELQIEQKPLLISIAPSSKEDRPILNANKLSMNYSQESSDTTMPKANDKPHSPNLYFADFYCMFPKWPHYLILVLTRRGSEADEFCQENLLEISISNNPFFCCSETVDGLRFRVSGRTSVEIFYTEPLDLDLGQFDLKLFKKGTSRLSDISKRPGCSECNL